MDKNLSVKDIEGNWTGDAPTGLIQRCKESWSTPLIELSDLMVSTYLNQKIATGYMIKEAERRLNNFEPDDTELFDGQLQESLDNAKNT